MQYLKLIPLFLLVAAGSAFAEIKMVTTTQDLASITESIGGDRVEVHSLGKGHQDMHYLSARPDFIVKTAKADGIVYIGMDLEIGWLPLVLRQSGNGKLVAGSPGNCNASRLIKKMEVPSGEVSRQMGDIHIYGNPHYWTDPINGILIGKQVKNCLNAIDPAGKAVYEKNYREFVTRMKKKTVGWLRTIGHLNGKNVIGYHREFVYFAKRFKLNLIGHIEPKPGVSPGPAHMEKMEKLIRDQNVKAILATPWNNLSYAQTLSRRTSVPLLVLPIQTGSMEDTDSYEEMFDKVIEKIAPVK